jgi:hypothetical protein
VDANAGYNGNGYGGGGGGGVAFGTSKNGGWGTDGIIIIHEYS